MYFQFSDIFIYIATIPLIKLSTPENFKPNPYFINIKTKLLYTLSIYLPTAVMTRNFPWIDRKSAFACQFTRHPFSIYLPLLFPLGDWQEYSGENSGYYWEEREMLMPLCCWCCCLLVRLMQLFGIIEFKRVE